MIPLPLLMYANPCKFWVYTEPAQASLNEKTNVSEKVHSWERKLLDYNLVTINVNIYVFTRLMLLILYFSTHD